MNKISLLVKNLLKKNKLTSIPIDIEKIANSLGVQIKLSKLEDNISGFLYLKNENPVIFVNNIHPVPRQRFTIAHELGHLILNHNGDLFVDKEHVLYRDSRSKEGSLKLEREANRFAAELLMPEEMIIDEIVENEIDLDDPKKLNDLAKKFKVSTQALTIRLNNLGWTLF